MLLTELLKLPWEFYYLLQHVIWITDLVEIKISNEWSSDHIISWFILPCAQEIRVALSDLQVAVIIKYLEISLGFKQFLII